MEANIKSILTRIKEQWRCQCKEELCEMAAKGDFRKIFKKPLSNTCLAELSEQVESFQESPAGSQNLEACCTRCTYSWPRQCMLE